MKRYCLIRRNDRKGAFYSYDQVTGKREALGTFSQEDAKRIIDAKNEALRSEKAKQLDLLARRRPLA